MQTDSPFDFEESNIENQEITPRPFGSVVLWLGVLGLAILFVPLYLMSNTLDDEVNRLASEIVPLQTSLASTPAPPPQAQGSIVTLTAVHSQNVQMEAILPTLQAENFNWSATMGIINQINGSGMQISGIEQAGNQLIIRGRALNDGFVTDYANLLEASGQFSVVEVRSIVQVAEPFLSPTPTPLQPTATATSAVTNTPNPTATPTSPPATPMPTWTATPKLTDDYEWDDASPKPIFLGTPAQLHNFYPDFDVDHVTFLAKAGRSYEVSTDFLAPGVDTFLTVTFGDMTLTNDDAALGLLSSSVILQAPPDGDVNVWVEVSNRGVYGADKWYDLLVEEVVPTTPTVTPTPTTAVPTLTPSATPDLRDIHEPNDIDPNPIAIGEAQIHNFFPNGDVDKVGVLVKNGRFYQILTSQLAVGVDTAVTVNFNGETWSNDDYDLPGSGNFASAVCFPAEADGTAIATITNLGQQFDASKTYIVTVQEAPFLTVDPQALDFGTVIEGGSNPPTQTMQIEGSEPLDWQATTETSWLSTNLITGTTPTTLTVMADISGLAAGLHEGEITWGWSNFCRQTIPVSVQVDPLRTGLAPEGSIISNQWSGVSDRVLEGEDLDGRSFSAAKMGLVQAETVEFVIVVTMKTGGP